MNALLAENSGTIANGTASAGIIGSVTLGGMGMPDWAAALTGMYFLVSTVFLVMKIVAWRKGLTNVSKE